MTGVGTSILKGLAPYPATDAPLPALMPATPWIAKSPHSLTKEVPVYLEKTTRTHDVIILGAGCGGLSLCHYLLGLGYTGRILVLDQKDSFVDDRTWSFWDVEPTPFSHLAEAHWDSWTVSTDEGSQAHTSSAHPYLSLRSIDFYQFCIAQLKGHRNVTVRLGESVERCEEADEIVRVSTDKGVHEGGFVFDARGLVPSSAEFRLMRDQSVWLPQHFLGQRIRTFRAVFDDSRCSLMDFRVGQDHGAHFMYLLPQTPKECLIEDVYFSFSKVSFDGHRGEIAAFLLEKYGLTQDDFTVQSEESGFIPMSDHRFRSRAGSRITAVGTLAGATRPSTGYAFLRIQRECRDLATEFVLGVKASRRSSEIRQRLLDAVFLRFMRERPQQLPSAYLSMFRGVPPKSMIRFMTERSTVIDEMRLVLALPKLPFIMIVLRMLAGRNCHGGEAERRPPVGR